MMTSLCVYNLYSGVFFFLVFLIIMIVVVVIRSKVRLVIVFYAFLISASFGLFSLHELKDFHEVRLNCCTKGGA